MKGFTEVVLQVEDVVFGQGEEERAQIRVGEDGERHYQGAAISSNRSLCISLLLSLRLYTVCVEYALYF